jgi:hypothetical protein
MHMRGSLSTDRRSLNPRVTPKTALGRGCLSTCSEDHKARQQQATPPPATPGADLGLWAPGGQARHLILPAGQAGRHKRRSREGRKDREETEAERRPERWTEDPPKQIQRQAGPQQPQPRWDPLATAQLPPPSTGPSNLNCNSTFSGLGAACVPRVRDPESHIYSSPPRQSVTCVA